MSLSSHHQGEQSHLLIHFDNNCNNILDRLNQVENIKASLRLGYGLIVSLQYLNLVTIQARQEPITVDANLEEQAGQVSYLKTSVMHTISLGT